MNPQPQSIYQRVIDKTKTLGFQSQFMAQTIEKLISSSQSHVGSAGVSLTEIILNTVDLFLVYV